MLIVPSRSDFYYCLIAELLQNCLSIDLVSLAVHADSCHAGPRNDPISGDSLLRADEAIHKADVEDQARAEGVVRAEEAIHKAEAERKRAEVEAHARMQADLHVQQEIPARTQAAADLVSLRAELEAQRRSA